MSLLIRQDGIPKALTLALFTKTWSTADGIVIPGLNRVARHETLLTVFRARYGGDRLTRRID